MGNHHLVFRPLTDPTNTIVSDSELQIGLPLKTIVTKLHSIPKVPFQVVGVEFFGLNRFVQNFLDWAIIQVWLAVRIDELEQSFWCLDRTNPNGESVIPGSVNIIGYIILLNGKVLSIEETKKFYNELRHREYNWKWYEKNNTSWREIVNALNAIQKNEYPLSNVLANCKSLGLLDSNMNITDVGSSLLIEQSAVMRKQITYAGIKLK